MSDLAKTSAGMSSGHQEQMQESESGTTRRDFVVMAATAVGCAGAAAATVPFIRSMSPDAGVLALSSVEVDVSNMIPGEMKTVMWSGRPVFIFRRTEDAIKEARDVDINTLKDPQLDEDRVIKGNDEWLIVVGICTHLGCVPVGHKGDYDGWFCPCHGSQYDTSGRIRKGPAPSNLEVPKYEFISKTKIKIG